MNPMWLAVRCLWDAGIARARAVREADSQAGAITLEWIVIAGILVVAAIAAGVVFGNDIKKYEGKIP